MVVVLSSRKFEQWIQDPKFRQAFPEFSHVYQQYEQAQKARRARGLCSGCGSMRGIFPRALLQLKNSITLSRRLKEYLGAEELRYVDRNARAAEVKTLA